MSHTLQSHFETLLGKKCELKINDNRSTMLSVKWEPDCTKVSLHRMFLQAPNNVMEKLACYISRADDKIPRAVRSYIEDNLKVLDYSHTLDRSKLITQGTHFNLQELYTDVVQEYFEEPMPLLITWFGTSVPPRKRRQQVTLGLFHDQLRLIKINRILDQEHVPQFFVRYVIYHEMLHFVCPSYIDDRGIHRIHYPEFKRREKRFQQYEEAQRWIEDNQTALYI
jgi:hypothetical protein